MGREISEIPSFCRWVSGFAERRQCISGAPANQTMQRFQENLSCEPYSEDESQQYFGLSLRELVHTYKSQMLVLFKCLLLQPKVGRSKGRSTTGADDPVQMLFFGSHCETVCQVQFSLLSLIPDLVKNLRDCADRQMNRYAETLQRPDSVRTSDRASLLAYLGVPLQIFGKGSVFGPYTPLQQLDILTDLNTKSYVVGSTNSLLIQQKDRYADILIDLDEKNITILSPTLRSALAFSAADRRWIDFLVQQVNDTWNENDPSRPKTYGYAGSEEFIRLQFEEYLLALLSAEKYHQYLGSRKGDNKALLADVEGDPSLEFAHGFLECWRETQNYKLWNRTTDSHLFDIVEPRHPCAGGLTIEDVQRRLAAQVAELHLDERFSQTREVVGKRLADGRTHVTSAFNRVWADIEVMREAQRRRAEESRAAQVSFQTDEGGEKTDATNAKSHKPDLQQAQASVTAAGQRAGAYLSSWGAWAAEKRRTGWRSSSGTMQPAADVAPSGNWSQVRPVRELGQEDVTTSKATPSESSSTAHITAKTGASLEDSKA